MSHHQSTAELVIGAVLLGGMMLFALAIGASGQKRLDDPSDATAVDLSDLPNLVALEHCGVYCVTILRQSRNLSSEQIVTGSPREALAAAISTFRRAGITAISIHRNTASDLEFSRLFYDYSGRASGKKVGRAIVKLVSPMPAPQVVAPQPVIEPPAVTAVPHVSLSVTAKCDCGHVNTLDLDKLEEAMNCASCGGDIAPTREQVARIRTDAVVASARIKAAEAAGLSAEVIVKRVEEGRAQDHAAD